MPQRVVDAVSARLSAIPWPFAAALGIVLAGWILYRLLAHHAIGHVSDPEKRHRYRNRLARTIAFLVLVVLVLAFFEALRELGTILGFIGAGLAIALREYLASFLGWFYILTQRNISLGSRIEVGAVRGDVIDIGVFKLTLVEIRGEGLGDQSSGRLVTLPNFKILTDPVFHLTPNSPFVWDEMEFTITFESDWEEASRIIERVAWEEWEPHREEVEAGFRELESAYAFRYGVTTPFVYVVVGQSGVTLQLRYLTHVRQRRNARDRIHREVLRRLHGREDVRLAYPTSRVFRSEGESSEEIRPGDEPSEERAEDEGGERPDALGGRPL